MKKTARRVKIYALFIIGFLLIGIIAFEVYLRTTNFSFNPPFFEEDIPFINRENVKREGLYKFDFSLFWKYRPSASEQINSLGFRDREFSIAKKEQFRIVVLGDSCTAGHQLPSEDTYVKHLERLLDNYGEGRDYEVINAGVPGYTSFQGLRYFRRIAQKYNPDLVIAHYGTNDRSKALYPDNALSYAKLIRLSFIRLIGEHTKIAQFMMKKICGVGTIQWKTRVTPKDYRQNLDTVAKEARRMNIEVLFIKPCLRAELNNARENNVYVPPHSHVNLFEVFSQYRGAKAEEIFFDSLHFTELGHKLLADEIYSTLIDSGMIELNGLESK